MHGDLLSSDAQAHQGRGVAAAGEGRPNKVAEIESRITENAGLFVVNYNGLTVKQAQELRHQLRRKRR